MVSDYSQLCSYPDATVLIIDGAKESSDFLQFVLSNAGYSNITTSNNPHHALDLWREVQPDVMLLDYQMPVLNGMKVLKQLASDAADSYLPVIMLTATEDEQLKLEALALGAKDFSTRPINMLDLLARINNVIRTSKMDKRLRIENSTLDQSVQTAFTRLESEQVSREKAEMQLQHNMLHDTLTELPNKALFYDRVDQYIATAEREHKNFSIVLLSIENLRNINNTLGHYYGDMMLIHVAERLNNNIRKTDSLANLTEVNSIARLAGKSFALAISNIESHNITELVIDRILEELKKPYNLEAFSLDLNFHVGIVHYPVHGDTAEELLQHADVAAYNAKNEKIDYAVYSSKHDDFTTYKLTLMQDLKYAIHHNQLELYLQPKIHYSSHDIYGYEALLRWQHPEHGFIPPDQIIETAEKTGLIEALTMWVITTSCKMLTTINAQGFTHKISLNITATDLLNPIIVNHVLDQIKNYRLQPEFITLEITEGSMIKNPQRALDIINVYRETGINVSIDDFGTGYSSLAYLQKLPVNELKIDRSFVTDMCENRDNQMIIKSIIDIAHHLKLHVVAEGIENVEVYDMLMEFGCDSAQGYFLSRPITLDNTLKLLKTFSLKKLRAG